ncbi:hypothetical protein PIB30_030816, partial [Stylosanthes scabra]|nr:hypothetical protein [Stylosanthes scabra]
CSEEVIIETQQTLSSGPIEGALHDTSGMNHFQGHMENELIFDYSLPLGFEDFIEPKGVPKNNKGEKRINVPNEAKNIM